MSVDLSSPLAPDAAPDPSLPRVADVLIPLALDTAYSYAVAPGLALKAGDVVQVPLGPRETVGVVWSLRAGAGANFKSVAGRVDAPGLAAGMRRFGEIEQAQNWSAPF